MGGEPDPVWDDHAAHVPDARGLFDVDGLSRVLMNMDDCLRGGLAGAEFPKQARG